MYHVSDDLIIKRSLAVYLRHDNILSVMQSQGACSFFQWADSEVNTMMERCVGGWEGHTSLQFNNVNNKEVTVASVIEIVGNIDSEKKEDTSEIEAPVVIARAEQVSEGSANPITDVAPQAIVHVAGGTQKEESGDEDIDFFSNVIQVVPMLLEEEVDEIISSPGAASNIDLRVAEILDNLRYLANYEPDFASDEKLSSRFYKDIEYLC
ncbi:uncharacterized protein LOC105630379 isoform X1 [Jatropha curcas]|uniref:uncharacterized protein LOC105630379 isoform X1 n=2 Tax=Jatropha curcas TaxID=180498 RepID=UPI0009D7488A|nr:uncharacterized protein LOC105630379 isoform X1 [Jatropha curcas]